MPTHNSSGGTITVPIVKAPPVSTITPVVHTRPSSTVESGNRTPSHVRKVHTSTRTTTTTPRGTKRIRSSRRRRAVITLTSP